MSTRARVLTLNDNLSNLSLSKRLLRPSIHHGLQLVLSSIMWDRFIQYKPSANYILCTLVTLGHGGHILLP